jgi:hypothetical protein
MAIDTTTALRKRYKLETVLTENVPEKITCRIYGPVMANNICGIRYNEESKRLRWLGHVERMEDNAMPKIIINGNCIPKEDKEDPR